MIPGKIVNEPMGSVNLTKHDTLGRSKKWKSIGVSVNVADIVNYVSTIGAVAPPLYPNPNRLSAINTASILRIIYSIFRTFDS